jgi:phage-related protein (TIGR01555 family)
LIEPKILKADGILQNLYSSLNTKRSGLPGSARSLIESGTCFSDEDINRIYVQHRFIQNTINLIPEDCNLHQPDWKTDRVDIQELRDYYDGIEAVGEPLKRIDLQGAFTLAMVYGRKFGDGFIFLGIDDGLDPSEPVDYTKIKAIDWVAVKHKGEVGLDYLNDCFLCYFDPLNKLPNTTLKFHQSRVLRFPGIKLHGQTSSYHGYNDSVITSVYSAYLRYLGSLDSGADMLASHSVFKYGLKGLGDLILKGRQQAIKDRFLNILEGLSSLGGLIYDSNTESAEFANRSYSGVKDILEHLQEWLIACSGLPRSKIFGNAATSSLSEGSEGDRRIWNEIISRHQHTILKPNQLLLGKYILAALGVKALRLDIEYPPHYQLSALETSELKFKNAQTDKIYHEMGVPAEEIIKARFGGTKYEENLLIK